MSEAIQRQAKIGLYLLEDAILEVLYEHHRNGEKWVKAADIRKHLGLPKVRFYNELGDFPIRYILSSLSDGNKVEQRKKKGPWRITDEGIKTRGDANPLH